MTLHRIKSIRIDGLVVVIAWDDGKTTKVDMAPVIARGGLFGQLRDPAIFGTAHIGDHGRSLAWTGSDGEEIDFCADALRQPARDVRSAGHAA